MINTQAIRETLNAVLTDVSKDDAKGVFSNPYETLKSTFILEARQFNESPLKTKKCFDTLTKMLHLIITKGGVFTPKEESDLFFGVTKLFQSENPRLRRMVYLSIKTMNIGPGDAFIITSSLTKDMNSSSDVHRANAIRVLSKIIDASMALQLERYLKTAIVDKSPFVSSAALVCGIHLLSTSPDVVRRWINEITECVKSKSLMVQFHALALLYDLKKQDRLALLKIVGMLTGSSIKGPLAECLLIRYVSRILRTEKDLSSEQTLTEYLEARLRHRSDIVVLEAARAIFQIITDPKHVAAAKLLSTDLTPALTALQVILSSQKSVARYAATRTLSQLAQTHPQLVSQCTSELESLLNDSNRSVATLAQITLLKIATESDVERLLKQVSKLIPEFSDKFRIQIIQAVNHFVSTYSSRYEVILEFLASQPREEGSFEFKRESVNAMARLITTIPQAHESGLLHLCEFIEDCEFPSLCTQTLHLIGKIAPETSCPSKYIRFVYNRLLLESTAVRAAAINTLVKIAARYPQLHADVAALIESCLEDVDDEIRDRANLYYLALKKDPESASLDDLLVSEPPVCLDALIEYLENYLEKDVDQDLNLNSLPSEEMYLQQKHATEELNAKTLSSYKKPGLATERQESSSNLLTDLQRFVTTLPSTVQTGSMHHTVPSVFLTEKEAEYRVECVKHIYESGVVVLEFSIINTMKDQHLKNVKIVLTSMSNPSWGVIESNSIESLPFDTCKSIFVALQCEAGVSSSSAPSTALTFSMNFTVTEESDAFGYEDSYTLESLTVSITDFIIPHIISAADFKSTWSKLGEQSEVVVKLNLSYNTLEESVVGLIELLGLAACDGTDIPQLSKPTHDLLLCGITFQDELLLCRCMVVMSPEHGCLLKACCRCQAKQIAETLLTLFD